MSSDIQISTKYEAPAADVTCRICRRQFAKYTCPTCNVPYCSLTCFRSESHNQCSESFYKKEVESDIHSEPARSTEERIKMMELLKNFEQESVNVDHGGEDEDEENNLARRLGRVDLDSASPEFIWSILSPEERKKFTRALEDPTSELAQQLLASEVLEKEIYAPWWEKPSAVEDHETPSELEIKDRRKRYGAEPQMLNVPREMIKPLTSGSPLIYNICALCIGYSYIVRHFGISSLSSLKPEDMDHHMAKKLVAQITPFLTDMKSTTLFLSLTDVVTDVWSRFELGKMDDELFAILLYDASILLEPRRITYASTEPSSSPEFDPSKHPHVTTILVLSDLIKLFSGPEKNKGKPRQNHVTRKLLFYAAHIISTPTLILQNVANSVMFRSKAF